MTFVSKWTLFVPSDLSSGAKRVRLAAALVLEDDSRLPEYSPLATYDDGSCSPLLYGCMHASAYNYRAVATLDDGSCLHLGEQIMHAPLPSWLHKGDRACS